MLYITIVVYYVDMAPMPDRFQNAAVVKVVASGWIDYLSNRKTPTHPSRSR